MSHKLRSALFSASVLTLVSAASAAHAASDVTVDPEATTQATGVLAGGFAGLIAAFAGVAIILGIVGVLYLIIWIWALVDVLGRQFPDPKTKTTWVWLVGLSWPLPLILAFIPVINFIAPIISIVGLIIVIVYLASIRKQGTKK